MTRRGTGAPQVESDFMGLLMKAGLNIQQARLALSNPVVAQEIVALVRCEAKNNTTAQIMVEKHEPYVLERLKQTFLGGVTDAYGPPTSWKDCSVDADHERRGYRIFAAKRYKETVKTTTEIVEPFRAVGFRPANLHEACAYLMHHLSEVRSGNAKCQRDIILFGTVVIIDGKEYVPCLVVQAPSATEIYDYRLEFVPMQTAWGLGEWFLFVREEKKVAYPQDWNF